jgi:hypothetical protein
MKHRHFGIMELVITGIAFIKQVCFIRLMLGVAIHPFS